MIYSLGKSTWYLHPNRGRKRKRGDGMTKMHIANHFAEWMKRIGERLGDLESNHEELESQLEDLEELDTKHEELSEKVEDLEGELAVADSRIDDLESEAL
jgi:predicted  nucleic acid-binding Zn-ribbon protein